MQIFGMEKLSLVDYDGKVCCTLFTAGCNFKCGFCHNGPLVVGVNKLQPLEIEEVLSYIAERIDSNVRELEGALLKIISYAGIKNSNVNMSVPAF